MSLRSANFKSSVSRVSAAAVVVAALAAAGCNAGSALTPGETFNQGYVIDEQSLELVPPGSSREQVLLTLGSPSTTATFDNEVFYYISQKRVRSAAFMNANLVDQRILAVYFGADGRVASISNYGMKDGRIFDFLARTTPTGGKDQNFLGQMLQGVGGRPANLPGTGG